MSPTRIKICGITREGDARAAVDAGADAIGLVFHPASPRAVTLEQAAQIAACAPPFVTVVGLFVDASAETVAQTASAVGLGLLQFQGDESPEFCARFERPWVKALHVRPGVDLAQQCERYRGGRGVLLDTWREGTPGGTGETFDWRLARGALCLPVILAGGLDADNVGRALRAVSPAAVDVSSGVERAPGRKDPDRMRSFVQAVRRAEREIAGESHDSQTNAG